MLLGMDRVTCKKTVVREVLVFDFDGTLADTLEAGRGIFNQIAPDYGYEQIVPERSSDLRQLSLRGLLKTLGLRPGSLPGLIKKGRAILREQLEDLNPCAGIFEALPAIRESAVQCGVLTSNLEENVDPF